ncbi:MAG: hypothetical protein ACHQ50_16775, partial [Fimbriimonadales bacterium]
LTAESSLDWDDLDWARLGEPWPHFGGLKAKWTDREEGLAHALLRRAIRLGSWDTSLLRAVFLLQDRLFLLQHDLLPTECWVWVAEHVGSHRVERCGGEEFYYWSWRNAFDSLAEDENPVLERNCIAVLLAGRLFNRAMGDNSPSIQRLLERLKALDRDEPTKQSTRLALAMLKYGHEEIDLDHLTAADRLAVDKAINELKQNEPTQSIVGTAAPSGSAVPMIEELLERAATGLRSSLGETTWARLSQQARDHFKQGELHYTIATAQPGEGGDFKSFVLRFSDGLLQEIQSSLMEPVKKDSALKGKFRELLRADDPEWPDILSFLENQYKWKGSELVTRLLAQGVKLKEVASLRDSFRIMKDSRDRAAHTKHRIDREEAALLHNRLVQGQLIAEVVRIFSKPPPR